MTNTNTNRKRLATLRDMLSYCRPRGSATEKVFIARYLEPLPGTYCDEFGNHHVTVGPADPTILFSCHTDTVHRNSGRQTVHYDPLTTTIELSRRSRSISNCLGADDTVGVFIMREMILAGIPGHYIFHYGEESGGIGSRAIAEDYSTWLKTFTVAIAFDRRGSTDVITHQGYGRCCSNVFAKSLATALRKTNKRLNYKPCDHGIYTDTAEYVEHIAECSNVSVGYYNEHSRNEFVATRHTFALLDALLAADFTKLVVKRMPEDPYRAYQYHSWDNYTVTKWKPYLADDMTIANNGDSYIYNEDETAGIVIDMRDSKRLDRSACQYLDPEWQEVQDTIQRMEEEERKKRSKCLALARLEDLR